MKNYKKNTSNIIIPPGVKAIEDSAFYGFEALTSVVIPDSVTSIGVSSFFGCGSLKSIMIPGSVASIGRFAFGDCKCLKNIILSDGIKEIGKSAFSRCESLESIDIPGSVMIIGDYAFELCLSLKSVVIADGVKSIGLEAFYNCGSLNSVTIPGSVTHIEMNAFSQCHRLTVYTPTGSVAESYAKKNNIKTSSIKESGDSTKRKFCNPDLLASAKKNASGIPASYFHEIQEALHITEEETRAIYFISKIRESVDISKEAAMELIKVYYGCSKSICEILFDIAMQFERR